MCESGKGPKPQARDAHVLRFSSSEAAEKAAELKQRALDNFKGEEWNAAATKYRCASEYATTAGSAAPSELLNSLLLNEAQCHIVTR